MIIRKENKIEQPACKMVRNGVFKMLNNSVEMASLSAYKELNVFVCGIGVVGSSLMRQIANQQQNLFSKNRLKINIIGVANTKYILLDEKGISPENYKELLPERGVHSATLSLRLLLSSLTLSNVVFVDCTADSRIAGLYDILLSNGISVVTANKLAASSSQERYARLKQAARQNGVKFLYETNVGAGLPIINTINDLVKSGDRVLRIEAVLSGTLNYIFNQLSKDIPLSRAVEMAKKEGYSEPDPRIDLSGTDVIRKLVILVREAGYLLERDEIENCAFLPSICFEGTPEDFKENLLSLDSRFEKERSILSESGKCQRFVAQFESGKGSVGLSVFDRSHPFYNLPGSNNMILLTTERYREHPLVIQGYGAGAEVTAAGVFADIIRIANV